MYELAQTPIGPRHEAFLIFNLPLERPEKYQKSDE